MTFLIHVALSICLLSTEAKPNGLYFIHHELQGICVAQEILDTRELRYVFSSPDCFDTDLSMIRRRAKELYNAPMTWEVLRFAVVREQTGDLIMFNRAYQRHLEHVRDLYPVPSVYQAIEETETIYRAWDSLRDAQSPFFYVCSRRDALAKLRSIIGPEAFERGEMCSHVPFHRFASVR